MRCVCPDIAAMARRVGAGLVLAFLAGCGAKEPAPEVAAAPAPTTWHALLIAGDDAQPAFDNGVAAMRGTSRVSA